MKAPKITMGGRLLALVIGFILFLGVAEIALRIAMPSWNEFNGSRFVREVAEPGYGKFTMGRPGFDGYFAQNNGDFRVHVRINEAGLRNDQPVQAAQERIWVIGDSMSFGWGVERKETYTARLANYTGKPTYNLASPATALCGYQGILSRMPDELKPKAVVLGLILENDILNYDCRLEAERTANTKQSTTDNGFTLSKVWFTRHSALYNVLAVTLKRVRAVNAVLVKLGLVKIEHSYRRVFDEVILKTYVAKTVEEIVYLRKMLPTDLPFVTLVVAARFEIRDDDPFYRNLRLAVLAELRKLGIPYVDILVPFKKAGFKPTHFAHDGHWSPLGHDIAAKALAIWFKSQVPSS